jgi:hypothetical protein
MVVAECELILLFDPQKLGISHEFKCVIASLCRHHKKYVWYCTRRNKLTFSRYNFLLQSICMVHYC